MTMPYNSFDVSSTVFDGDINDDSESLFETLDTFIRAAVEDARANPGNAPVDLSELVLGMLAENGYADTEEIPDEVLVPLLIQAEYSAKHYKLNYKSPYAQSAVASEIRYKYLANDEQYEVVDEHQFEASIWTNRAKVQVRKIRNRVSRLFGKPVADVDRMDDKELLARLTRHFLSDLLVARLVQATNQHITDSTTVNGTSSCALVSGKEMRTYFGAVLAIACMGCSPKEFFTSSRYELNVLYVRREITYLRFKEITRMLASFQIDVHGTAEIDRSHIADGYCREVNEILRIFSSLENNLVTLDDHLVRTRSTTLKEQRLLMTRNPCKGIGVNFDVMVSLLGIPAVLIIRHRGEDSSDVIRRSLRELVGCPELEGKDLSGLVLVADRYYKLEGPCLTLSPLTGIKFFGTSARDGPCGKPMHAYVWDETKTGEQSRVSTGKAIALPDDSNECFSGPIPHIPALVPLDGAAGLYTAKLHPQAVDRIKNFLTAGGTATSSTTSGRGIMSILNDFRCFAFRDGKQKKKMAMFSGTVDPELSKTFVLKLSPGTQRGRRRQDSPAVPPTTFEQHFDWMSGKVRMYTECQGDASWFLMRAFRVTSSIAASLLPPVGPPTPSEIVRMWDKCLSSWAMRPIIGDIVSERFKKGHAAEAVGRAHLLETQPVAEGHTIVSVHQTGLVVNRKYAFMAASPDAIVEIVDDATQERRLAAVEFKTSTTLLSTQRARQVRGVRDTRDYEFVHVSDAVNDSFEFSAEFRRMVPDVGYRWQILHHAAVIEVTTVIFIRLTEAGNVIYACHIDLETRVLRAYLQRYKDGLFDPCLRPLYSGRFTLSRMPETTNYHYFRDRKNLGHHILLWQGLKRKIEASQKPIPKVYKIVPGPAAYWNKTKTNLDTMSRVIKDSWPSFGELSVSGLVGLQGIFMLMVAFWRVFGIVKANTSHLSKVDSIADFRQKVDGGTFKDFLFEVSKVLLSGFPTSDVVTPASSVSTTIRSTDQRVRGREVVLERPKTKTLSSWNKPEAMRFRLNGFSQACGGPHTMEICNHYDRCILCTTRHEDGKRRGGRTKYKCGACDVRLCPRPGVNRNASCWTIFHTMSEVVPRSPQKKSGIRRPSNGGDDATDDDGGGDNATAHSVSRGERIRRRLL